MNAGAGKSPMDAGNRPVRPVHASAAASRPSARSAAGGGAGAAKSDVNRISAVAAGPAAETQRTPGTGAGSAGAKPRKAKSPRSEGKKRTSARKSGGLKPRGRRKGRRYPARQSAANPQQPAEQVQDGGPVRDNYQENAYTAGYELGLYEGGELLLEQAIPSHLLLPEIGLREIIAMGTEQIRHLCQPLMDAHQVFAEMEAAIAEQRPCSVVRLGDGELLTLAQGGVYDDATIQREGGFLPYAGVHPPDTGARDHLADAVRQAHIVGVPQSRRKHFQPLLHPVLRSHRLAPASLRMTSSAVNYSLHQAGLLNRLLADKRLLVIGNAAPALAHVFGQHGFHVTGMISPVRGVDDVERVMNEVRGFDFNLAIVSAGIAAVILCVRIAHELGKTALDFGHMADGIIRGKYTL
ncbi:GT-D fold domain-containing protein [Paenibacillus lycopersici]|uniref:GT-D fold domain-containing protein n=1 Tax=Paenibacillus lycopersici TaxID=2704462 RepID=UPI001CDC961C|nr:GT-D fold domain-containing glycosyltransferase [Paenibacillus lycopersici]